MPRSDARHSTNLERAALNRRCFERRRGGCRWPERRPVHGTWSRHPAITNLSAEPHRMPLARATRKKPPVSHTTARGEPTFAPATEKTASGVGSPPSWPVAVQDSVATDRSILTTARVEWAFKGTVERRCPAGRCARDLCRRPRPSSIRRNHPQGSDSVSHESRRGKLASPRHLPSEPGALHRGSVRQVQYGLACAEPVC